MYEIIEKGGVMMYPILASSVIAVAVILERLLVIGRLRVPVERELEEIDSMIADGDERGVFDQLELGNSPIHRVLLTLMCCDKGGEPAREKAAILEGDRILHQYNRRLGWLSVLGSLVPLMGLLGTVIGMINVFVKVAAAGDVSDISLLAGGIWEALLTTAAGMTVAIPILLAYHWFEARIERFSFNMGQQAERLIATLRACGRV